MGPRYCQWFWFQLVFTHHHWSYGPQLDKPHASGVLTAYIKGAPERVLAKCSTYLKDGQMLPITDKFKEDYDDAYDVRPGMCALVPSDTEFIVHGFQRTPRDRMCSESASWQWIPCQLSFLKDGRSIPYWRVLFRWSGFIGRSPQTWRSRGDRYPSSCRNKGYDGYWSVFWYLVVSPSHNLRSPSLTGDHPKTAEAIARKINLILGDTRETLAKKTGRSIEEVYEDEATAIVVHGDDIDGLQGWQWDQSPFPSFIICIFTIFWRNPFYYSLQQGWNCIRQDFPETQAWDWLALLAWSSPKLWQFL